MQTPSPSGFHFLKLSGAKRPVYLDCSFGNYPVQNAQLHFDCIRSGRWVLSSGGGGFFHAARILEEGLAIHSPPALFFFFFLVRVVIK